MRTPISVQMQGLNSDGSALQGTVSIRAKEPDSAPTYYSSGPSSGVLDIEGRLVGQNYAALQVWASDDEGFSTVYIVVMTLVGMDVQEFQCYVPAASTATEIAAQTTEGSDVVTLTSLIAANAMLGQSIVGANWPDDTIVTGISTIANTVTISNPATTTGNCTAAVGGCVLVESLQENQI